MKFKKLPKLFLILIFILILGFSGSGIFQKLGLRGPSQDLSLKEASAAATFISSAKNNSKVSGNSLTVTVPAGGWAAGSSVIVTVTKDDDRSHECSQITGIADTAGNTYTMDVARTNNLFGMIGCTSGTIVSEIWSAHNINALSAGNTITITFPASITAKAAVASNFTGLTTTATLDRIAHDCGPVTQPTSPDGCSGTNTDANSSNTLTTSQAYEFVVGSIGAEGPIGETFTKGSGYTLIDRDGSTGGSAPTNVTNNQEYRIVSSTGQYSATGTLGTGRNWIALVATYKIVGPPPVINYVSSAKNTSKTSGNTLTLTVPAGGWAAGSSVIVTVTNDSGENGVGGCIVPTSITDSAGNSYNIDRQFNNRNEVAIDCTSATLAMTVFSSHSINALLSGQVITINFFTNITAKAAVAANFTGLAPAGAFDKAAADCGFTSARPPCNFDVGTAATSGSTQTTTQADELLIGVIGPEGPLGDTFEQDTNYALIDRAGTTGGAAASNVTNNAEYRIVSSTGSYSATGTLGTGRNWLAVVATYKALLPPPVLTLNHYRWRDDSTALNTSGGVFAKEDTAHTIVATGSTTRWRVQVKNTSVNPATGNQYRLEYARKLGSSCGTFSAVPTVSGSAFQMVGSAQYANNDAVIGGLLTSPGLTFFSGYGIENPSNATPANTLPGNNYTELEYAIKAASGSSAGGAYCFRVTNSGYAGDFTYSYYPELKVAWSANWLYYQPVSITNNVASVLTDYETKLTLNTQVLITAGKLQSQCQDLRFVGADGITRLAYFLEPADCNSTTTPVWIKDPSIPASGTTTINMYYGNTGAVSEASGDETFAFFDSFESGTLNSNKWPGGAVPTIDTAQKAYGTYSLKFGNNPYSGNLQSVGFPPSLATAGVFEGYARYNETNRYHYAFNLMLNGIESYNTVAWLNYWGHWDSVKPGWTNYPGPISYTAGIWYPVTVKYDFSDTTANPNGTYWSWVNSVPLGATALLDYNLNPHTSMTAWAMFEDSGGGFFWVDDVRMRHYAAIEPTVTLLNVPTLTLPTSADITNTTATLGATVSSDGGSSITARGICWDISAVPIINCSPEGGTSVGLFTMPVTELPPSTLIYYRGYATSSSGTGYSPDGTFITNGGPSAPILTSPTVSSVTDTTATLGATILSDGGASITARGTCWDTSALPTVNCVPEGGTSTGAFTQARTVLPPNTLIYYRGYATNSNGTDYSPDGTFTTLALPTLTSPTAGSITSTTAILGANVTSDGGSTLTARGTCWGTSANPVTNCAPEGGTTTGIFTQARTGLPPNTLIYYRGYATSSVGTGYSPDGAPFNTSPSSASGILTSIVFDTGTNPAYNSMLWKGTLPSGTKVRFKIAASNSSLGPWNDSDFIGNNGTSCGSAYWYEPGAPNLPIQLGCTASLNSKRYFKYRVQLCSATDCITQGTETPVVTDIIVNWAPQT